ncbi:hypothetical protein [Halorussus salinus]|uniref:hypothetical protein n=1 Tax=Halorussus salinus TaxID=1364935 RepID=UPI001092570E|nr:hypothetical protein [Halorussus salinus]
MIGIQQLEESIEETLERKANAIIQATPTILAILNAFLLFSFIYVFFPWQGTERERNSTKKALYRTASEMPLKMDIQGTYQWWTSQSQYLEPIYLLAIACILVLIPAIAVVALGGIMTHRRTGLIVGGFLLAYTFFKPKLLVLWTFVLKMLGIGVAIAIALSVAFTIAKAIIGSRDAIFDFSEYVSSYGTIVTCFRYGLGATLVLTVWPILVGAILVSTQLSVIIALHVAIVVTPLYISYLLKQSGYIESSLAGSGVIISVLAIILSLL